ncbi:hypothetical protein BGZ89_005912 [Linnemannia elongata]|nr:hypothetical protein BGZ89_005912 [Linnemannia elongata]
MNVAPPLSGARIKNYKLSIWNYFIRLSNIHNQTVAQKQTALQGFVSRLFSNDAIGNQISTQLSPILHTPDGRGTGTTSETKQLIETAIRSALSTPFAPVATKVEYDSHIEIKQAALCKTAMENLESHLIGGMPAVRCPHSMAVQRLEDVMELIQVGRFGPAIHKMSSHWSPTDCMAILDRGLSLYLHALTDDALLPDQELRHAVTQAVASIERDITHPLVVPGTIWKEGYYDRCQATICPASAQLPFCFKQSEGGSCATMVLVNFLINQPDSQRGASMSNFIVTEGSRLDVTSVQNSTLWKRYHHMYLWASSKEQGETPFLSDRQEEALISVSAPSASSPIPSISSTSTDTSHDTTGNHIILIMPYKGNVFELDSDPAAVSPTYLGPSGTDWTITAQVRLQQWSEAAHLTTVHNDVHAYISDN